jgi:hypothetical protein
MVVHYREPGKSSFLVAIGSRRLLQPGGPMKGQVEG